MDYKPRLVRASVFVYKWGRHGLHTIPPPHPYWIHGSAWIVNMYFLIVDDSAF